LIFALCKSASQPVCFNHLLRIAVLPEWAPIIAAHSSHWKSTSSDSIRLMYVLVSHHHVELKEELVLQFLTLLNQSLDLDSPPFSAITLILKKLPLTESIIAHCEESGFLAKFLSKVSSLKTHGSRLAATAFVERIGIISWQPSLQIVIENGILTEKTNVYGHSILQRFAMNEKPLPLSRTA
jgi:hypothetical protein